MLIEFKVSNFRSIREEQVFSLVGMNSDKTLPGSLIESALPGLKGLKYLKGAAIYGANASGKTNIFHAIHFLSEFVTSSVTRIEPDEATGVIPFKLNAEWSRRPTEFEITFVAEGVRYLFGLSLTTERVIEEFLVAYPKGAPQRWYHRSWDETTGSYSWTKPSSSFKDDKILREKTRPNSLFLSVGPQFGHPQLTPVYVWFRNHLRFLNLDNRGGLDPVFTASLVEKDQYRNRLIDLLRTADMGVADATIEREPVDVGRFLEDLPDVVVQRIKGNLPDSGDIQLLKVHLSHRSEGGESIVLDFEQEESAGTRRFFSLIGPWLDILENGYTVFIDEIETSLHPILVKEFLRLLLHGELNSKGAQVVFTTHNPLLLDTGLLRRDQIWFTEKAPAGNTILYSLTEYRPRKGEALMRGYLSGRYGAIPFIPEGLGA